jgi:hypothetical protein
VRRGDVSSSNAINFLSEVGVSVFASLLFVFILRWFFSPKVIIDDFFVAEIQGNDLKKIRFRICNGSFRQALDLSYSAHFIEDLFSSDGRYANTTRIDLITDENPVLERFDRSKIKTDYYNVVGTSGDLGARAKKFWQNEPNIRLRIRASATDPVSQVRKVFTRYYSAKDAKGGNFLNPVDLPPL